MQHGIRDTIVCVHPGLDVVVREKKTQTDTQFYVVFEEAEEKEETP